MPTLKDDPFVCDRCGELKGLCYHSNDEDYGIQRQSEYKYQLAVVFGICALLTGGFFGGVIYIVWRLQ